MSIILPPDLEAIVLERVAAGLNESPESVLREALERLRTRHDDPELEEIVDGIMLSMEQARRGEYLTAEEFEAWASQPIDLSKEP